MLHCPVCGRPLETLRQRDGVFYQCSSCEGRALSIPQIRRIAGDPFAVKLMRLVKLSRRAGERLCPFCNRRMMVIQIQEPPAELDGCEPCKNDMVRCADVRNCAGGRSGDDEYTSSVADGATGDGAAQGIQCASGSRQKEIEEEIGSRFVAHLTRWNRG